MTLGADGSSMTGGIISLGEAEDYALKNSDGFKEWMQKVTLAVRGPGVGQPLTGIDIMAPPDHVSTKVKV